MAEPRETPTRTPDTRETPGRAEATAPTPMRAEAVTQRTRATELVTSQGKTTIADDVVAKIAAMAAQEVDGVHELVAPGMGSALAGLTQRMTGADSRMRYVSVEVGEREAAIDLRMTVHYGMSIPQVAEAVRRNVINRIQAMTGLAVKEVNIDVTDLFFPEERAQAQIAERRVE